MSINLGYDFPLSSGRISLIKGLPYQCIDYPQASVISNSASVGVKMYTYDYYVDLVLTLS